MRILQTHSNSKNLNNKKTEDTLICLDESWLKSIQVDFLMISCSVCTNIFPTWTLKECLGCRRIFCHKDYSQLKNQGKGCPICNKDWKISGELDLVYRKILDGASMACKICQQESKKECLFNYFDFWRHMQNVHSYVPILPKKSQLSLYELVNNKNASKVQLGITDQVSINSCYQNNSPLCILIGKNKKFLRINLQKKIAKYSQEQTFNVLSHKNAQIKQNFVYKIWTYFNSKQKVYFDSDMQKQLDRALNKYRQNNKLNQILVQGQTFLLRVNFRTRQVVDVQQAKAFTLLHQQIVFK